MSTYKMVVTDLDRTLLTSQKEISKYTKDVIQRLRDKGILFVIATARPVYAVVESLPFLSYDSAVYQNGGIIYKGNQNIANYTVANPYDFVMRLLHDDKNLHVVAVANDTLYANFNVKTIWPYTPFVTTMDFNELKDTDAEKILVEAHSKEEMEHFRPYLNEDLYMELSENQVAMIMHKQATKLNGITCLAKQYGISLNEIVAFGDDYSDLEMLKNCGKGVAVANAIDVVKETADEICDHNDRDGVAHWLSEHLL